jgi:hypothetical protein
MYFAFVEKPNNQINSDANQRVFPSSAYVAQVI